MDRRRLLKNLGLGAGYVIAAPTLFSLLQSCKNSEEKATWEPVFLTANNGYALTRVLDVIIPKDDTPGASELNIAQFIDMYMDEVADDREQQQFKARANAFAIQFKSQFDKDVADGNEEDYKKIVANYLGGERKEKEEYMERLSATQDPEKPKTEIDTDASAFGYLQTVRDQGIWAWKTSEQVGENVLWYDPVPGVYLGCIPVAEAGNGKTMSL